MPAPSGSVAQGDGAVRFALLYGAGGVTFVDRRAYMSLLIRLSRVDVDACGPFLEGIPDEAVHFADHPWWESVRCLVLYEAMARTLHELS